MSGADDSKRPDPAFQRSRPRDPDVSPRHEPPHYPTGYAAPSASDMEATVELELDAEATSEINNAQLKELYRHLQAQKAPVSLNEIAKDPSKAPLLDFGDGFGDEDPTGYHKAEDLIPESFADVGLAHNLSFDSDATRVRPASADAGPAPLAFADEKTGLLPPGPTSRGHAPYPSASEVTALVSSRRAPTLEDAESPLQRSPQGPLSRSSRRWRIQTEPTGAPPRALAPEEEIPTPAPPPPASTQWVMPNSSAPGSIGPTSSVDEQHEDGFEVFSFDPRQSQAPREEPPAEGHDPFLDAPTINYEPLSRSLDLPEEDPASSPGAGTALGRPLLPGRLSRIRTVALDRYQVNERLMILRDPEGSIANKYRMLDFKLRQIAEQRPVRTVALTAPQPGSGTSLTALNLALIRAESPHIRVALVDLDLRHPSLAASMGVHPTPSLLDLLEGKASLEQVLVRLGDTQCYLLPGGENNDKASRLYKSPALTQIFARLYELFDLVVMDLPSVIPRADINLVNPLIDAIVMVVAAGRTQGPSLRQATEMIDKEKLIGVVLNEAPE